MATRQTTIDFLLEQAAGIGAISARKMFGEWALYLDGKLVALICDDRLFVKPTSSGQALLDDIEEAPPYPGAEPWFVINDFDDADALAAILRATADALPAPKPKPAKKRRV